MTPASTVTTAAALAARRCVHQSQALDAAETARLLAALPGWRIEDGKLCKRFQFRDYYQTMAYVNALAWLTHTQDHHPELTITYQTCAVRYATHSVNGGQGGLSENDFICAAGADALSPSAAVAP